MQNTKLIFPEIGFRWRSVPSAGSNLFLSCMFLITWISPEFFGTDSIRYLLYLLTLEFIVIHSSLFLESVRISKASKKGRLIMTIIILIIYIPFPIAAAIGYKQWWPLVFFWGLTVNKIFGQFSNPPSHNIKAHIMWMWGLGCVSYVAFVILTLFLPLPRLGILSSIIGTGIWAQQPYRAMCDGFFYFLSLGIAELFVHPSQKER